MRKSLCMVLLMVGSLCGLGVNASGAEFHSLGFEAMAMGGAGVASSRGSYAAYYNPALLAAHKYDIEVALSAGVGLREMNVAERIDTLSDIGINETLEDIVNLGFPNLDTIAPGTPTAPTTPVSTLLRQDIQTIQHELRVLSAGNGLELMPSASLGVQVGNYGFGVFGLSDISATAVIDSQRLNIVVPVDINNATYYVEYDPALNVFTARDQAYYNTYSLDSAIEAQTTSLRVVGVTYLEIPVAYGHKFDTAFGALSCGGALKIMPGRTYLFDKPIDTESDEVSDDLDDYEEASTTWGVDAGVLFTPAKMENLSLGLVLKNINTPEFDLQNGGSVDIEPQARLGIAYEMLDDKLTLALDADLTQNEVLLPGYYAQYIGGGVNYRPASWFSLRGGLMKNIHESDEGTVLTAGLGIGAKWFQIDIAGQYSLETGEFDGNEVPRYGRVQLALVSKW